MANSNITDIFSEFQTFISHEQESREKIRSTVKDIEQQAREVLAILQSIHLETGIRDIPENCVQARKGFENAKAKYSELMEIIPDGQYYRFHEHWRFVSQRLVFLIALTIYLETGRLATREEVADILGMKTNRKDGFVLDLEDYLVGLLQLASELARFAVNSVTAGDYTRPIAISKFVTELNSGFRLLNLKNDGLRKRFDVLKYDVKKIEEVVYDLSIRGLCPKTTVSAVQDEGNDESK
ncbi:translin [Ischnura elegans]|uniref:translin n=1 Tax=Ischnura elegans TaxID=197161 RepID=UPI001ED868AE|nr:translin [Ischnura elegans]